MTGNYQTTRYLSLSLAIICIVAAVALTPTLALAELPPRPTRPASQTTSDADSGADSGEPVGGYIRLQMPETNLGLWTVVQWQDQVGKWHDVEGWRGNLDDGFQKTWWVHPANFGQGPFRWVIYQSADGPFLAASNPFYLPTQGYQILPAELPLKP